MPQGASMESLSIESFSQLLRRAGLDLPLAEAEHVKLLYDAYQERMKSLYAADVDEEEVAGDFSPV